MIPRWCPKIAPLFYLWPYLCMPPGPASAPGSGPTPVLSPPAHVHAPARPLLGGTPSPSQSGEPFVRTSLRTGVWVSEKKFVYLKSGPFSIFLNFDFFATHFFGGWVGGGEGGQEIPHLSF